MQNKITINRLAAMLAISTGKQKKLCEDFIKELFRIVTEELSEGENVRIKGFGSFRLVTVDSRKSVSVATGEETQIPSHSKIAFVPSKELAAAVNEPFEAFEAVELAEDLAGDINFEENTENDENSEPDSIASEAYEVDDEKYAGRDDSLCSSEGVIPDDEKEPLDLTGSDMEKVEDEATSEAYEDKTEEVDTDLEDELEYDEPIKRHGFVWGFGIGFLAAVVVVCICFGLWYFEFFNFGNACKSAELNDGKQIVKNFVVNESNDDSVKSDESNSEIVTSAIQNETKSGDDGEKSVPTVASDELVYDTVTTTRYLTTIAKEHYGNFNLWPVIYEENNKILGHPDRIKPGTRVVVPRLSKYSINPSDPEDIKRIKAKGIEIYSRYKR